MNAFADWLFSALLGWTGRAANSAWNAMTNGSGGFGRFLAHAWLPLLLILLIVGTLFDFGIWFFRWRPDRLWRSRKLRRRAGYADEYTDAAQHAPAYDFPGEDARLFPPAENAPAYPAYAQENAPYADEGAVHYIPGYTDAVPLHTVAAPEGNTGYPEPFYQEPAYQEAVYPQYAVQGQEPGPPYAEDPIFMQENNASAAYPVPDDIHPYVPAHAEGVTYDPPFYSDQPSFSSPPDQNFFPPVSAPTMCDDSLYRRPPAIAQPYTPYAEPMTEDSIYSLQADMPDPAADGEASDPRPYSRRSRAARKAESGRLKNLLKDFMKTDNFPIDELPPPIDYRQIFPDAANGAPDSSLPPKEDT